MSAAAGVVSYGGRTAGPALRAAMEGVGALPAFDFYTLARGVAEYCKRKFVELGPC